VFASLIIPALAGRFHPPRRRLAIGYAVGVAGYALGLSASAVFDLPSGAVTVWALALCGVVFAAGAGRGAAAA
jgi:zinc/manganese transport system permease protein